MTGVEILASNEVVCGAEFGWVAFWCAFGLSFGSILIVSIISCIKDEIDVFGAIAFSVVGLILGGLLGVLFGGITEKPNEYEMQYKVVVSDEVSMNEFYEKYEIIDQDGKIYTVRERF